MDYEQEMTVLKRDGLHQEVSFDKILQRVKKLGAEVSPPLSINYSQLVMKVIDQLYDKIPTYVIDELTAEQCASLSTKHLDYATLANRIIVSNNHKITTSSFYTAMETLYNHRDIHGEHKPIIHQDVWIIIQSQRVLLDQLINYERDYMFDYFGFKTLERSYLMRVHGVIVERPQHMWLRVALGIHGANMAAVKETYDLMSQKYFTHATPTLYNAGTPHPQLSSCYLLSMESDSIDGIYNTLKECAQISKWAGGIGLHIHNVRATGTSIIGTNGSSNGIVPMLQVFNSTARYVDQGGGKRNGSFAIYLEPWHADVEMFLDLKKNHGDEELRARDLFYALWIPDLFMERVKQDSDWALFCPHKCPGLADCHGAEFRTLYERYSKEGKANKTIKARQLWFKILDSQMETGTPYLLYKDAANAKSNQQNLGTIKSSNLCVAPETLILTDAGYFEIQTLQGQTVNVWNGEEFSETVVQKTGINQELITVETSDGCSLDCTPYHKFYIESAANLSTNLVEAAHLKPGDRIISCEYPIIDGKQVYQANRILVPIRDLVPFSGLVSVNDRTLVPDHNRALVPINASLKHKIKWLSDYFDYDTYNNIIINGKLYLANMSKEYILNIKLMLQTCGINARITSTELSHTLLVSSVQLQQLSGMGFKSNRVDVRLCVAVKDSTSISSSISTSISPSIPTTIKKIIHSGRIADTYCFNETKKHAGIFNGIITSQCTEVIEYSNAEETAVCNLASIGLSMFVKEDKTFDYEKLHYVTKVITANLNNIIDVNFYPTEKTRRSNLLHRPIGIGVQGLADSFAMMDIPYHSAAARETNTLIFETIYHAALEKSNDIAMERAKDLQQVEVAMSMCLAAFTDETDPLCNTYICNIYSCNTVNVLSSLQKHKPILAELTYKDKNKDIDIDKDKDKNKNKDKNKYVGAYSSFAGSPASNGILQFDMWGVVPSSGRYDWSSLKEKIVAHGLRNSLLVAPMPTASTSQILGNNECFEPFTSNIYSRRTNAGEFVLVNKYLMAELNKLGIWNEDIKNNIIFNKGSIQQIDCIPVHIREKYKIVWEIPMKHMIDMAADRGAFICQSQSLNLWMEDPEYKTLTSMHFYAWEKGLKTGIYYLRRKAKHQAQQFTIVPGEKKGGEKRGREEEEEQGEGEQEQGQGRGQVQGQGQGQGQVQGEEGCEMCSS